MWLTFEIRLISLGSDSNLNAGVGCSRNNRRSDGRSICVTASCSRGSPCLEQGGVGIVGRPDRIMGTRIVHGLKTGAEIVCLDNSRAICRGAAG